MSASMGLCEYARPRSEANMASPSLRVKAKSPKAKSLGKEVGRPSAELSSTPPLHGKCAGVWWVVLASFGRSGLVAVPCSLV